MRDVAIGALLVPSVGGGGSGTPAGNSGEFFAVITILQETLPSGLG